METNSRLDSVLLLSSINLPGGELVSVAGCFVWHPKVPHNELLIDGFLIWAKYNFTCVVSEKEISRR